MKKLLLSVCIVLAILGCGGDVDDNMPCLTCVLCGKNDFNSSTQFCFDDTVYSKCSENEYYPSTEFCSDNIVYSKCSENEYYPSTEFCSDNIVYSKCSGREYNPSTEFCSDNIVYSKCNENEYYPSTEFCSGNMLYSKCSGREYNPSTEFCLGNAVYSKCGKREYDLSMQFCSGNAVYSKCNNREYDPSTGFCSNDTVKTYGTFTDSRNGQTYRSVVIGNQTWMAENLNYSGSGAGVCYDNNSSNCNIYGKLYNWAEAMAFPQSCNSSACSDSISFPKHQGICPSGWHLPSDAEWKTLTDYSDESSKLKTENGWNIDDYGRGNGKNTYGFSAQPGGRSLSYGNFYNAGDYGYWWSTSESAAYYAYSQSISHDYNNASRLDNNFKQYLFSVRCVKD